MELPNKMALGRSSYFIVQDIYRGWDRLAWLLAVELAAMIGLAVLVRRTRTPLRAQWEFSHLAGAVFQVLALCALIVAAPARGRDTA